MAEVIATIPTRVTEEMNNLLLQPYSDTEIHEALLMMGPTKSPGPDGFNALFFQRYWDIVGRDVISLVKSILEGGSLPPKLNHTHVVLIPKVHEPTQVAEFRPISLCNVVYKIVTKVISNRLKKLLHRIISETQSAFIPGRLITDNILIAYEVFHSMINQRTRNGSMAIKVDMSKAYDRVEWSFLRQVMLKLGFRPHWVEMVMACVESASFSILINGSPQGCVKSSRGLRQGDPISPYLFLFVTEGLMGLLRQAESTNLLRGHLICRGAPPISHLLFADDSIFFCKASKEQARVIKKILKDYEEASGQQVNFSKSTITFGRGIQQHRKDEILLELDIREILAQDKYLGLPTHVSKSKKKAFLSIKDRIGKRLSGWMNRLISWAGREVLIKAVAQAIPTYAMSIFKLPKDLCLSIQAMINRFWWSHDPDKRKIHWVGRVKLCDRKANGGLGFRDLDRFNDALLTKQVWRLLQDTDSLVARLLKSKYYPAGDILSADLGHNPSYTWRSLHGVKWIIEKGSRWIVGDGCNLHAWTARWIPRPTSFTTIRGPHAWDTELKVADFIDKEAGCWREDMVRQMFLPVDAEMILRIPLCTSWPADKLIWHFTSNGSFSVRSAYHLLGALMRGDHPSSSNGTCQQLWKTIWDLDVPPRIRIFGWKVVVGALATKVNIARRINNFSASCDICGHVEDSESHALFDCPLAVEVWQESDLDATLWKNWPLSAVDRLMKATQLLDHQRLGEYVAIMWEVWNERNRVVFGQGGTGGRRRLAARAVQFVRGYRDFQESSGLKPVIQGAPWTPPDPGIHKLNFDAGKIGDECCGWGFVIRDNQGDVELMGVKQGMGFSSPEVEEARACLFALRIALNRGFRQLIVEGDCQALIGKLKAKSSPNNSLGYFISDILSLSVQFDFLAWSFIRRKGNTVAHAMAHLQPIVLYERIWGEGGPESIYNLATNDMCAFLDHSII